MKLGFIGLGRMGGNMVLRQLEQGNEIVAWNRSPEPREELWKESKQLKKGKSNLQVVETVEELVSSLRAPAKQSLDKNKIAASPPAPRNDGVVIWLMVTAGDAVDQVLKQLIDKLSPNDLVVDGGNSFYKDTLRRNDMLSKKGIHYMDVGTSGGIESAREGACLMIGGSKEDFERVLPIVKAAAWPEGFGLLGSVGAGHFAKMAHNGIEYGMMEAIGEGAAILKYSDFKYDLREVFRVYSIKSIIDSRLISWLHAELEKDPNLDNISSVIGSGGSHKKVKAEAHWTVDVAKEMGLDVPSVKLALKVRANSDKDKENSPKGFRNKAIAAMRWQFGHHPVKKS